LGGLLPTLIDLLNDLTAGPSPVETLPGATLKPEDGAPAAGDQQPLPARNRQSIRWQLRL
jgi:hypothetical protein